MRNQLELWSTVLEELGNRCSVSTATDLKTIRRRYEHEGDKLFTVTLPSFGKDFERSLALGRIPTDGYVGWRRRPEFKESLFSDFLTNSHIEAGKAPYFLGGFMDRVFDASNGALFDEYPGLYDPSDTDAIHAIRQLTLMFSKLKVLPDREMIKSAYNAYVETDLQIANHFDVWTSDGVIPLAVDDLKVVFKSVFGTVCSYMDELVYDGRNLIPKHGPGATAEYKMGNQKYSQSEWTERMEPIFPFVEYAIPNHRYHYLQQDVVWRSPEQEIPSRIIAVPKTARTPRIIAIEPVCMQYMQQAVALPLVDALESRTVPLHGIQCKNPAYGLLGFSEQWPNQAMAHIGSEDGSLATLDLSEASDRVPNWLVEVLLEEWPWFSEAVQVTRSTHANVPGHGVIPLNKYASMGSALTFPIEAMVFLAISMMGIMKHQGKPFSRWSPTSGYLEKVRVYGDDIIVPTDSAESVVETLEIFGFKVNRAKSFWTGRYRESCGKEYYRGDDVSIVKLRQPIPSTQTRVTDDWTRKVLATVSTRNQFYKAGMWKTASFFDEVLEVILKGWYPFVGEESPVLGRFSFTYGYDVAGMFEKTQAPFIKGYVPVARLPKNEALDEAALMKCLLKANDYEEQWSDPLFPDQADQEHLTRSGRPRAVGIKLVKASPF